MNQPTPAIVAQESVRRLPRLALLALCVAYILAGFLGREPWKSADIAGLGYMLQLAQGGEDWLHPTLLGQSPATPALLPYWLGAAALKAIPWNWPPELVARAPFIVLLAMALAATWYGAYFLARSPQAQPVSFAFGGEANPKDYARAIADGALLALVACLGLAQLSHETTAAQAQLCFCALSFFGFAALPLRPVSALFALAVGLTSLALSGAPAMATLVGLGGSLIQARNPDKSWLCWRRLAVIVTLVLAVCLLSWSLDLWRWKIDAPPTTWLEWKNFVRLWVWFSWPAWPLALWTLWRWRRQRWSHHLSLPLWFLAIVLGSTLSTRSPDRALLLALPALSTLAAFSLPTFSRSLAALIDWFTLLFFSGWAFVIWVVWISVQSGFPAQPAANVARLAPGFVPAFSWTPLVVAAIATMAWIWLVRWRTGRHRAAIWKTLVMPAGGTVLCWLLLMTLWLPMLDYGRSYGPLVRKVVATTPLDGCVATFGLNRAQTAAFQYHGKLDLAVVSSPRACNWLLVDGESLSLWLASAEAAHWRLARTLRRPTDDNEAISVFKRVASPP